MSEWRRGLSLHPGWAPLALFSLGGFVAGGPIAGLVIAACCFASIAATAKAVARANPVRKEAGHGE